MLSFVCVLLGVVLIVVLADGLSAAAAPPRLLSDVEWVSDGVWKVLELVAVELCAVVPVGRL